MSAVGSSLVTLCCSASWGRSPGEASEVCLRRGQGARGLVASRKSKGLTSVCSCWGPSGCGSSVGDTGHGWEGQWVVLGFETRASAGQSLLPATAALSDYSPSQRCVREGCVFCVALWPSFMRPSRQWGTYPRAAVHLGHSSPGQQLALGAQFPGSFQTAFPPLLLAL